jgi:A/G-specific adenine glycosylase
MQDYGGKFPQSAQSIGDLPGIGRSTAAAIAAFSFGERAAILDGNVKRVLARCFGVEGFPGISRVEAQLWALADKLLPKGRKFTAIETYTQGLMDLGATVCTRTKPSCEICPVTAGCVARKTGRIAHLPALRPKKNYPTRLATWLVLRHREKVLLEKRPSHGIWGGLWVFPEFAGADLIQHCRSEYGCVLSGHRSLPTFTHGFTHFRLEISPVICTVGKRVPRAESPGLAWSTIEEAAASAVPAPVRKLLELL